MAKIRGFKPDLWTDEDFVELTPLARLLWMGMWSYACDNGHLADKSKQIKMRLLPTDDVNVAELLREIEARGLIERSEGWVSIPNLTRHQKVDRRYFTTCEKPGCVEPKETSSQRESRRAPAVHTPGTPSAHAGHTPSAHGDGDGEVKGSDGDRRAPRPRRSPELPIAEGWKPTTAHQDYAESKGLDLSTEAFRFRNHALANDRRQRDWDAAFRVWLSKAVDFKSQQPKRQATQSDGRPMPEAWQ